MAFRPSLATNIVAAGFIGLISSSVLAAGFSYKMNAMCYLEGQNKEAQAFNPTSKEVKDSDSSFVEQISTNVTNEDVHTKFRIASLSKVLVSHWAVATLGPEHRFKTTFFMTGNTAENSCYVHMKGEYDIFLGKEILVKAFGQLHEKMQAQGCKKIAQLTYDENVVIPNFGGNNYIVQHRNSGDFKGSNPTRFYGPNTTLAALKKLVKELTPIRADVVKASLAKDFEAYRQSTPMKAYSFRSRPLYMLLREFNTVSSNVPPNLLFERLGGRTEYNKFIKSRLGYSTDEVDMYNGSGYPVTVDGEKIYNEVSCAAFVRTVQDLDNILRAYKGSTDKSFQLADILPVGGPNEGNSTLKTLYSGGVFHNVLVAKTGSAEQAIAFGGMISTDEGPVYFGVLTAPSAYIPSQLNRPRKYIRDLVMVLMERYDLKKFSYDQVGLMNPFDSQSDLQEEVATTGPKS